MAIVEYCEYCGHDKPKYEEVVRDRKQIVQYVKVCGLCNRIQEIYCVDEYDYSCNGINVSDFIGA